MDQRHGTVPGNTNRAINSKLTVQCAEYHNLLHFYKCIYLHGPGGYCCTIWNAPLNGDDDAEAVQVPATVNPLTSDYTELQAIDPTLNSDDHGIDQFSMPFALWKVEYQTNIYAYPSHSFL